MSSSLENPAGFAHNLETALKPRRFAHLHQHTQYSLLDGAARVKDLLKWVAKTSESNPAVAMTDHGNMHGAVQFFKYATEMGVKPIIGYEAYVSAGSRRDRISRNAKGMEGGYYHLTLLAKDFKGYQNLCKLASIAYLEGFYVKPRIDREVLATHHEGIIALSGCLGAEVPNMILNDRLEEAEERLRWYLDLFKSDYYVEIQNHGLPEQQKVNPVLKAWAKKYGIGMVATNDGHYVKNDDAYAHEVLLAIQTKALMSEDDRFKFPCNDFYVKSAEELEQVLPSAEWGEEIFDNSVEIAEKCNLELPIGSKRKYQMPALPIPEGRSMAEELRAQVYAGVAARFPEEFNLNLLQTYCAASLEVLPTESRARVLAREIAQTPGTSEEAMLLMAFMGTEWVTLYEGEKYTQYPGLDALEADVAAVSRLGHGLVLLRRAEYENGVIIRMGFPDYFLIVADFINWAKDHGIRVGPGRGSGAGSLVAYALRITNLDPLRYGLLFERFLNPDRISMPDFDVDFSDSRRNEVINYVRDKYGDDKVAMISTYGTMSSRACFKDVARVMELPYQDADRLSKLVPVVFGRALSLEKARETVPDIQKMLDENEHARRVFEIAQNLEGLTRHSSVHASGVVIGRERLDNIVPLMRSGDEGVVCQYDMNSVEDIGLIKMDFLGLRTLSFLEEAVRIIKESKGVTLEPDDFPLDDAKAYEIVARGETKGVFQLEGGGITDAARKLKPRRIEDINALSALYRPGPMENIPAYIERHHGREEVRYDAGEFNLPKCEPLLRPILEETYGIPVYQEQIMQIASAVAGYSLGQSDLLRRAMGKKKLEEMEKERVKFVAGAKETHAIPQDESTRLFGILEKFANYGFNKCVAGDTLVVDSRTGRRVRVLDIVQGREPAVVVPSLCEPNLKIIPKRVTDAFSSGHAATFLLETETGRRLEATGNHPVFTPSGWKNLEDVRPGEFIAVPRHLPYTPSGSLEPHELVLLGYALSEGNLCHPTGFYLYAKLEDEIADMVLSLESFENSTATLDRSKSAANLYAKRVNRSLESGAVAFLRNLHLLGLNALDKHVPEVVFTLPQEQIALFLGRLWTGDGGVQPSTRLIHYATSSRKLAEDVQHLLLRLGVQSRIHAKKFKYRETLREGYTVHVLGGPEGASDFAKSVGPHLIGKRSRDLQTLLESYLVNEDSRSDVLPNGFLPALELEVRAQALQNGVHYDSFVRGLGFRSGRDLLRVKTKGNGLFRRALERLALQLQTPFAQKHAASEVYWDAVVGLEPRGVQEVFDLTVEGTHSFVANDIVVHNSHSAAYAFISFQTAYIKAHYPVEFMASLLTVERRNSEKVAEYISDARSIRLESGDLIQVLPPDISRSNPDFKVQGEQILFGLFAVKGLGEDTVLSILEERQRNGAFKSLANFCSRLHGAGVNRRSAENLIKAGAFDAFGSREALLDSLEEALEYAAGQASMANQGMDSLFGMATIAPEPKLRVVPAPKDEFEARARAIQSLQFEKEAVGLYISGHPLEHYPGMLEAASCKVGQIESWFRTSSAPVGYKGRKRAVLAGMISGIQRKPTKSGGMMARFILTDDAGAAEMVAFSRAYDKVNEKLREDAPALVIVELEADGDEGVRATVDDLLLYEDAQTMPKILALEVNLDQVDAARFAQLDDLLQIQEGVPNIPIRVRVLSDDGFELWELDQKATQSTLERLQAECPWLKVGMGIDGEKVLAKFAPAPKPWERNGQPRVVN